MFKKIVLYVFLGIIILLAYVGIKTITAPNLQRKIKYQPAPELSENALQHFQQAIQIKTISYDNPKDWDSLPFIQFRQLLEKTYPLVHQHLERDVINGYSYLYKWSGKDAT
ncbi:MAG TPA: hypothetical protein PLK15_01205, partial [Chitinophagales bacterium]|nr:hypothetical protein [Chitinophagales bacterium]